MDDIKTKLSEKVVKFKQLLSGNIEEILLFSGLFCIILATFLVNIIAGIYVLGFILVGLSVFLLKYPDRR